MSDSLHHLLTLAKAGKRPEASNAERQSRRLTVSILENAIGIDQDATHGLCELMRLVQRNPMSGREAVREAIR